MNKLNWRNTRYGWQSIKNHDMKKKRKKRKNEVAATKRPQVIDWLQTTDDRPVKFDGNYLSIDRFITHRNQIAYTQIVASRCKRLIILLLLLSTNHGDWQHSVTERTKYVERKEKSSRNNNNNINHSDFEQLLFILLLWIALMGCMHCHFLDDIVERAHERTLWQYSSVSLCRVHIAYSLKVSIN